ncbi:MAG: terminase small subunit [Proteobacteria bacterium]|nr:terminase small subunit [Pseudomonadota bacterium]
MGTTTTQKRSKTANVAKRGVDPVAKLRESNRTNTSAGAATVDVNKPLTQQQKLFAQFHAQGDSIPNALVRAGYDNTSTSYGYRLVQMPNIQAAIATERAKFEAANDLTRKDVFEMLKEAYDMAKLTSEPASMVAAAREIGKMAGYYEPQKREINVNLTGSMAQLNAMSTEQLEEMIQKAAVQAAAASQPLLTQEEDDEVDA